MKKMMKMLVLALAMAAAFGLGTATIAEAKTKVTVKSVKSVNKLTGSKTIKLAKGKKATLTTTVTVTPNKKANKKVTYKSSNKNVATVSSKGVITAKKAGTAKITVVSKKNRKKKATVKVTVYKGKVTSVKLDKKTAEMKVDDELVLKATIKASSKKSNKSLVWTSSDEKVATVVKGKVVAVSEGTATITAKATDGTGKKATCVVTVKGTTLTAVDGAKVEAEVEFADVKKAQEDIDALAKIALKKGDAIKVTLDGKEYTAVYDGTNVTINGKKLADKADKVKDSKVKVTVTVSAKKVSTLVGFAGATSVKSVTIDKVVFSEITATSFKMGEKTYNYTIDGTTIKVANGKAADFAAIKSIKAE